MSKLCLEITMYLPEENTGIHWQYDIQILDSKGYRPEIILGPH